MREGTRHFEERSAVHETLDRICRRLEELSIPYAVVGGMALFRHGHRRFTDDVDLLVTPADLKTVHERLCGPGYLQPFEGSKHLRDTETGVKVEFLTTGGFPGDGKPKPVSFPDPRDVTVVLDGVRFITLTALVELKLASGMTGAGRMKDLGDVQELIKSRHFAADFANQLNPYVQAAFADLWRSAQHVDPESPMHGQTHEGACGKGLHHSARPSDSSALAHDIRTSPVPPRVPRRRLLRSRRNWAVAVARWRNSCR